jgi:membrane-bound lytic murein transglycosylase B
MLRTILSRAALALLFACVTSLPALAAACHNSGKFEQWLAAFKEEAEAKGVSKRAIAAAAPHLTYSQRIVNIDRGQHFSSRASSNSPTSWCRRTGCRTAPHISASTARFSTARSASSACRPR